MRKKIFVFAAAALLSVSLSAEDGKAAAGWSLGQNIAGQVNPLGLSLDTRLFYTWPLFPDKRGILWDTARVEAGLHNSLTPAFNTLSVFARVEPAAFFDFSAQAGLRGYYDAFGYGFTPLADYDASWNARGRKDAERFSAAGLRYGFTATVKGAAGNFVFGSATGVTIYDMYAARGGMDYYYDPSSDTALKLFDGFLTNESLVLYTLTERPVLRAGVLHSFLYVPGSEYTSRRLCFLGRVEGRFLPAMRFSAAVLCGAFLRDRYNSWKDGKVYAAFQAGITKNL